MNLLAYMRRENLSDQAMAEQIGECSASAVKKYKYGERQPRAARMYRIAEITRGAVRLEDWTGPSRRAPATPSPPESGHPTGGGA